MIVGAPGQGGAPPSPQQAGVFHGDRVRRKNDNAGFYPAHCCNRRRKEVECKADMEVITEFDEQAKKAGISVAKDMAAIANSLRPFFVRKIENSSFDDDSRTSVTLQVHELVTFMQRHS